MKVILICKMGSLLLQPNVTWTKDLVRYGQNTQIIYYKVMGGGGLKNPDLYQIMTRFEQLLKTNF